MATRYMALLHAVWQETKIFLAMESFLRFMSLPNIRSMGTDTNYSRKLGAFLWTKDLTELTSGHSKKILLHTKHMRNGEPPRFQVKPSLLILKINNFLRSPILGSGRHKILGDEDAQLPRCHSLFGHVIELSKIGQNLKSWPFQHQGVFGGVPVRVRRKDVCYSKRCTCSLMPSAHPARSCVKDDLPKLLFELRETGF